MSAFTETLWQSFYPKAVRAKVPREVEEAFDAECDERLGRQGDVLFGVVLVCNLLWWPTDWLVFRSLPAWTPALMSVRIGEIITSVLYLVLARIPRLRPLRFWLLVAAVITATALAGSTAGTLGGPDQAYIHPLYVTLFGPVPLPLPLRRRVIATLGACLGLVAGFLAPHPEYLSSSHMALVASFLVFSCAMSIWFGHILFVLSRDNHVQAHELAEHGRLLESRVDERTGELRALLDHVETTREVERAHIARELHDELGQELSALRYSLGFTRNRYAKEPAAITANLEDLEALLRRTAQTTRNLVTDLRPRVIDDLGLEAAVEWLVQRTQKRSELSCEVSSRGDLSAMSARAAMTAFRLLQEAMTNAARHSQATHLQIRIDQSDGEIEIVVTDDGIGIDASRAAKDEASIGVGMLGMRERVQAVGGTLTVKDRKPERGTEVRCRMPCFPMSTRPALIGQLASSLATGRTSARTSTPPERSRPPAAAAR